MVWDINPGRGGSVTGGARQVVACMIDWREANRVLTMQASCRPEATWVFRAPRLWEHATT